MDKQSTINDRLNTLASIDWFTKHKTNITLSFI